MIYVNNCRQDVLKNKYIKKSEQDREKVQSKAKNIYIFSTNEIQSSYMKKLCYITGKKKKRKENINLYKNQLITIAVALICHTDVNEVPR